MNPPLCRHLRTKMLYMPVPQQAGDELESLEAGSSRHCWCNKTMTPVGLDDRRVNTEDCSDSSRPCYQPGG